MRNKNAIYVIRNTIDLKGASVVIPQGCTLKFEGGVLKNGNITYNGTFIEGNYKIYCICNGTVSNDIVEPHMYGARGDGITDDAYAIQQSINSGKKIIFRRGTYLVDSPIYFDRQNFIVDFNFAIIKKVNEKGCDFKYENYDFNKIPCIILIKPYETNTSGHIVIKNLILEGGKNNIGIHAIWCRNVILENVRIFWAIQGLVYGGFTNTFRDVTIWDCKEGFVIKNSIATLFERCFSSNCGWSLSKATGVTLLSCSSDDFNPCYYFSDSSVSMVGCTFESKGTGLIANNSTVNISGDFETHIYDATRNLIYLKAINNSTIDVNSGVFHLNNYLKKKIPQTYCFEVLDNSNITIRGKVSHGDYFCIKKEPNSSFSLNGNFLNDGVKY